MAEPLGVNKKIIFFIKRHRQTFALCGRFCAEENKETPPPMHKESAKPYPLPHTA